MFKELTAAGGFLLLSLLSQGAAAITYMAPLDQSSWQVQQSRISCQLRQVIPGFGEAVFEARAGAPARFYLDAKKPLLEAGPTQLIGAAPPWNPQAKALPLGDADVVAGTRVLQLGADQTQQVLLALEQGLAPELTRPGLVLAPAAMDAPLTQAGAPTATPTASDTPTAPSVEPVRIALSPARLKDALAQYRTCTGQLVSVSFEQVTTTVIEFGNQEGNLSAGGRAKLDTLLNYLKADATSLKLSIDAVSADTPRRLDNLALAKQRVQEISDYLTSHGIDVARIDTHYRAERGRQPRAVATVKVLDK